MDNQIEGTAKEFLLRYGYLMLLDTTSDTIESALTKIVSDVSFLNGYHNVYDIDIRDVYWEWLLLPVTHPDRIQINRVVWAQYLNHMLTKPEYNI